MKKLWLITIAFPLIAAAPPQQRPFNLSTPGDGGYSLAQPAPPAAGARPSFQPAPLPNRDANAPAAARASNEPSLAPTLFTTKTQFRGDGFSPGSTAQSEQERRSKPGAGFSLHMPFTPQ